MQYLFEIIPGKPPIPRLPTDRDGKQRLADGKTFHTLEDAAAKSGMPEQYLRDLWIATWGEYVTPDKSLDAPTSAVLAPTHEPIPARVTGLLSFAANLIKLSNVLDAMASEAEVEGAQILEDELLGESLRQHQKDLSELGHRVAGSAADLVQYVRDINNASQAWLQQEWKTPGTIMANHVKLKPAERAEGRSAKSDTRPESEETFSPISFETIPPASLSLLKMLKGLHRLHRMVRASGIDRQAHNSVVNEQYDVREQCADFIGEAESAFESALMDHICDGEPEPDAITDPIVLARKIKRVRSEVLKFLNHLKLPVAELLELREVEGKLNEAAAELVNAM